MQVLGPGTRVPFMSQKRDMGHPANERLMDV